jgi:hypothetical protein
MMTFNQTKETIFEATNSIKPVWIVQSNLTKYWTLQLDYGTIEDDTPQDKVFPSFDHAKRWAECEVGVKFNFE